MNTILIESHYFPSLEYFCAILPFEKIIVESHEHFVKQTDRNRCYVNTSQGPTRLVVPLSERHGNVPFKDVKIDFTKRWQNNHWRTIQSAYAKAPYFEHYEGDLSKVVYGHSRFLLDLNIAGLSFCLRNLGWMKELSATLSYEKETDTDTFDLRSHITSKNKGSGLSYYQPAPYYQVFGNAFAANLSLIDLLFSEGPNAQVVLKASRKEN